MREDVPQMAAGFEGDCAKDEQSITTSFVIDSSDVKCVSLAGPPTDEFFEADGFIAIRIGEFEGQQAFVGGKIVI